jgi:ABC-type dipeptide/oligopeptide/nickel transport system permease component
MLRYIANRLLVTVPVVLLVILITFTLGFHAPGDPIVLIYYENLTNMTPEDLTRLRQQYGLDRPYWVQYVDYMGKVLRGDVGTSIATRQPVLDMIRVALPITLQLGLAAGLLLIVVGIPLGVLAALRHNTWTDYTIVSSALFLRTIPIFVLAPMLMIAFVLQLEGRILLRHIVPNALGPIIVAATFGFSTAMILEASLSYLGIGIQPPAASWGR